MLKYCERKRRKWISEGGKLGGCASEVCFQFEPWFTMQRKKLGAFCFPSHTVFVMKQTAAAEIEFEHTKYKHA